jgi:hypothetical protein
VRKAGSLPPSVSWLSRENVGASTSHNTMELHGCYRESFLPLRESPCLSARQDYYAKLTFHNLFSISPTPCRESIVFIKIKHKRKKIHVLMIIQVFGSPQRVFGKRGNAVEALCYKPEGRGFDSRWSDWIF